MAAGYAGYGSPTAQTLNSRQQIADALTQRALAPRQVNSVWEGLAGLGEALIARHANKRVEREVSGGRQAVMDALMANSGFGPQARPQPQPTDPLVDALMNSPQGAPATMGEARDPQADVAEALMQNMQPSLHDQAGGMDGLAEALMANQQPPAPMADPQQAALAEALMRGQPAPQSSLMGGVDPALLSALTSGFASSHEADLINALIQSQMQEGQLAQHRQHALAVAQNLGGNNPAMMQWAQADPESFLEQVAATFAPANVSAGALRDRPMFGDQLSVEPSQIQELRAMGSELELFNTARALREAGAPRVSTSLNTGAPFQVVGDRVIYPDSSDPSGFRAEVIPGTETARTQERTQQSQANLSAVLRDMGQRYLALDQMGGQIVNPDQSTGANIAARARASGAGQFIAGATGDEAQVLREQINNVRPLLMMQMVQASEMSARSFDSNKELEFYIQAASDPRGSTYAALEALSVLDRMFGSGEFMQSLPQSYQDRMRRPVQEALEKIEREQQRIDAGLGPTGGDSPTLLQQAREGGAAQRISSDEEYDALPSGAEFTGPDGVLRRKP